MGSVLFEISISHRDRLNISVLSVRCPSCESNDDRVIDSRSCEEGSAIRRRRECTQCLNRFTTFERIDDYVCTIEKRSGSREAFSRDKIIAGVLAAAKNRPVELHQIEELASEIEESIRELNQPVSSQAIGVRVLEKLREIDDVASVRFSSVYNDFSDASDFEREVDLLSRE